MRVVIGDDVEGMRLVGLAIKGESNFEELGQADSSHNGKEYPSERN
jgi:hypothetical protein